MNITVYLGANEGNDPCLRKAVEELGAWIGNSGNALVYGGSKGGLMGALAEDVVNEFAEYLGLGLAHTAQVIDPEAFVIGGGVSKNGQVVADITKEKYEKNVMFALKDKEFRLAELGNDAGMYGAVRMVLVD